jgi:hypothetical protein
MIYCHYIAYADQVTKDAGWLCLERATMLSHVKSILRNEMRRAKKGKPGGWIIHHRHRQPLLEAPEPPLSLVSTNLVFPNGVAQPSFLQSLPTHEKLILPAGLAETTR